jgi:hypothetical protein
MSKKFRLVTKNKLNILKITFLCTQFFWGLEAFSYEVILASKRNFNNLKQVTSVSQLSEV